MRCSKILLWVRDIQCCPANSHTENDEPKIIVMPDEEDSTYSLTGQKQKKASDSSKGCKLSTPDGSFENSSMLIDKDSNCEDNLILEVISSPVLKVGMQLKIDRYGLYRSLRSQQDGTTYIGSSHSDGESIINDFVISHQSVSNIHCSVYYNSASRQFILKDCSDTTGTFIKIMQPFKLAPQQIVSFVDYHLAVNCITEEAETQLLLKFLEGTERESLYRFSPEQSPVTIGRSEKCTIHVQNPNLSRYQCQFIINDQNEWTLRDGRNLEPSCNGTWLYVGSGRAIENQSSIKVGDTLFIAKLEHITNIP